MLWLFIKKESNQDLKRIIIQAGLTLIIGLIVSESARFKMGGKIGVLADILGFIFLTAYYCSWFILFRFLYKLPNRNVAHVDKQTKNMTLSKNTLSLDADSKLSKDCAHIIKKDLILRLLGWGSIIALALLVIHLVSVAIGGYNYGKLQGRMKHAKLLLASLYVIEKTHLMDYDRYTESVEYLNGPNGLDGNTNQIYSFGFTSSGHEFAQYCDNCFAGEHFFEVMVIGNIDLAGNGYQ